MGEKELDLAKAISIVVGTIIGAGVLGLPYVVSFTGFLTGAIIIVVVYVIMVLLGMMMSELSLKNPGHQLVDVSGRYLGTPGRFLALVFMLASIMAALSAYYVGLTRITNSIFGSGYGPIGAYILFALLVPTAIRGLKLADNVELVMSVVMLAIIIVIIAALAPMGDASRLMTISSAGAVKVFGVATFALYGHIVIPEVVEEVGRDSRRAGKAVSIGIAIPAVVYIAFTAAMLSVFERPPQVATIGLSSISETLWWLGIGFAALAIASSAVGNALVLRDIIVQDFKLHPALAAIGVCLPSLMLLSKAGFAELLSIAGAIGIGGLCIIMSLSYIKGGDRRSLKNAALLVAIVFAIAAVLEIT